MRLNRWMISALAPVLLAGSFTCAALTGCGSSTPATTGPTTAPPGTGDTTAQDDPESQQHRMNHHGGVMALIAMSLKDLDLSADQKTKVEAIRADLHAKMEPAHAANKELANILADGVAAGAVDRAKADAAIEKLVAASEAIRAASTDSMQQLHDVLTPAQRTSLMDKVVAHAGKWHDSHGDAHAHQGPPAGASHMGAMKDLNLTDDQKAKIRENMKAMGGPGGPGGGPGGHPGGPGSDQHDHKELADHLQAFATAFKADTFDAKAQAQGGGKADGHMARFGATHMARFLEAAAPVLTPDQRTKLSASIRENANKST